MNSLPEPRRMDRRAAIKWMLSAAASLSVLNQVRLGAAGATPAGGKGYGADPDLLKDYLPGDLWPLTFTDVQRRAAVALCDVIVPADQGSPKASDLGVPQFIDEWVSSPYPDQAGDRHLIIEGLAWIDAEARRRYGTEFSNLVLAQQTAICDDISGPSRAKPEHKDALPFFKRYRDLTAGAYYTTPQGMADIGYVGNIPQAAFNGPPPEVLEKLGLD